MLTSPAYEVLPPDRRRELDEESEQIFLKVKPFADVEVQNRWIHPSGQARRYDLD
jgi:hypothetical protein